MQKYLLFLCFNLSVFACERTPPADPAVLQAWIKRIVLPENRHLKIEPRAFNPYIQEQIALHATQQLQKVIEGCGLYSPAFKNPIFFEVVQALLDLQADATKVTSLFVAARAVRERPDLLVDAYEKFAHDMVSEKKCSISSLVQAVEHHLNLPYFPKDDFICAFIINRGLLPQFDSLDANHREILWKAIAARQQRHVAGSAPYGLSLEMAMAALGNNIGRVRVDEILNCGLLERVGFPNTNQ